MENSTMGMQRDSWNVFNTVTFYTTPKSWNEHYIHGRDTNTHQYMLQIKWHITEHKHKLLQCL